MLPSACDTTKQARSPQTCSTRKAIAEAVRRAVGEHSEAETLTDKRRGHSMTTEHTPGGLIGRSVRRVEDPVLVTGKGCYVDDIQLPGMLHMAFLRSPYPHAKIISIDTSAAQAMPGVVAVVTGDDLSEHLHVP